MYKKTDCLLISIATNNVCGRIIAKNKKNRIKCGKYKKKGLYLQHRLFVLFKIKARKAFVGLLLYKDYY